MNGIQELAKQAADRRMVKEGFKIPILSRLSRKAAPAVASVGGQPKSGLTAAALGAYLGKDVIPVGPGHLTAGAWDPTQQLSWQRQRATGQAGLGQAAALWGLRPGTALASLLRGQGPDWAETGPGRASGPGRWDPATGTRVFDRYEVPGEFSPARQHQRRLLERDEGRLADARSQQEAAVEALEKGDYRRPWYRPGWPTVGGLEQERQARLDGLRRQLESGDYPAHPWLSRRAWDTTTADELERQVRQQRAALEAIGMLQAEPGPTYGGFRRPSRIPEFQPLP